jgi:photosystem II stability/assembly factor-like uncharacterized protein
MRLTRPLRALLAFALLTSTTFADAPQTEPYTWRNAVIKGTGFSNGIVFSPVQKDLIYQYTDMGGAYRWDEADKKWTPLNDWSRYNDRPAQNLGVEAMVAHPHDANKVYMVIGTYGSPAGMCRSDDQGRTWKRTDLADGNGQPLVRVNGNGNGRNGGNRLAIDPNDPNHLWYGSRLDGLWHSADAGVTWNRVDAFPVTGDTEGPANGIGIIALIVDGSSSQPGTPSRTMYALVSTTQPLQIYRSDDAGATWSPVFATSTVASNELLPIRAALTPDGKTMYVTLSNSPGPNGATKGQVVRIDNPAGESPSIDVCDVPKVGNHGFSGVCIDPSDPQRILVSTLDRWGAIDDLFLSTDAGKTWKAADANQHRDDRSAPYARAGKLHWIGDVQIDPFDSNRALFTTGYGLYLTRNLLDLTKGTSPTWMFFNDGFEQSALLEFATPFDGPVHLLCAMGDRDGFRHEDFDTSPKDGQFGALDGLSRGTSEDVDVAQHDHNKLVRITHAAPYIQYSDDNGMHWKWIGNVPSGRQPERNRGSLALSADGDRVVYSPGQVGWGERGTVLPVSYVTRSDTGWSDWTSPQSAPSGGRVLVDLAEPRTFYCHQGTDFWRSTDGGESWTKSAAPTPVAFRNVRAILGTAGHLLASSSDSHGVFRSTDGGTSWTRLAPDSVEDAYAVGVGAPPPGKSYPALYLAGSANGTTGYFRSDDEGATWVSISNEHQQHGWVTVIQGDPRVYGRLYVGTNGRGILIGEPARPPARQAK